MGSNPYEPPRADPPAPPPRSPAREALRRLVWLLALITLGYGGTWLYNHGPHAPDATPAR